MKTLKTYENFEPEEEWELEKDSDHFLITWAESGDEIHFILMDMSHWTYVSEFQRYDSTMEEINEFLTYIHNNKIDSIYVQTYTQENWFNNKNIKKVIYIPELGM